jgi:AcrR family transcriptional regulator
MGDKHVNASQGFTERQEQLIHYALQLIAEQGIEKLSLRNLARAVGISEPACYRHFDGKSALLAGILRYFAGLRRELFRRIRESSPDSLAAVQAVVVRHCELFEDSPVLVTLLFPEEIRQNRAELRAGVLETMRFGQEQLVQILSEGRERGEVRRDLETEHLALAVHGSLRLLVTAWRLEGMEGNLRERGRRLALSLTSLIRSPAVSEAKGG